jgi:signal transduction histidine kinase
VATLGRHPRGEWGIQLLVVFGVVLASFVAAMLVTQWQLMSIGRTSLEIADGTTPSIEHLASARDEMRHLEVLLRDDLDYSRRGGSVPLRSISVSRDAMNESIAAYLVLPADPTEQALWGDILRTKDLFNDDVDRTLAAVDRGDFDTADAELSTLSAEGDALGAAITRDIELNAEQSHALALSIARVQRRAMYIAFGLAAICAAITIFGASALRRMLAQRAAFAEERRRLVEARATELEQFAGRVAHDILSPLGTVALALKTSTAPEMTDEMRAQIAERGNAAIKRIGRLVNGLLAFAVAGAEPGEGAEADVEATIADLERDLREEAQASGAELHVSVDVWHKVGCNPGVLTSVVSNLARNAIKYIGEGVTRRIDIRACETRGAIRIEVQDTGPGLPPDLEPRVFEPYVRGHGSSKGGIGLGLATVKRVADAHHGRVGVKSIVGEGCTFWVELPRGPELGARAAHHEAAVVH